jgi:hypothetical protein
MSSANSTAASMQRNTAPAQRPAATRPHAEQSRSLLLGTEEAAVLKIDLSDVQLPKVGGLQVDGFKPSFFDRLFGRD